MTKLQTTKTGMRARIEQLERELARAEDERDEAFTELFNLRIAVRRYTVTARYATGHDLDAFRAMVDLAAKKR